jgi:catechol 2,3-dioxygenase-like lactoylglutathione lyase family enzyme
MNDVGESGWLRTSAASDRDAPRSTLPAPIAKLLAMDVRQLGWPVWIGIVCDDLQAQRRFYRDVLGFAESNVSEGSIWFMVEGKLLELFARSDRPQYARRGVAIGFVVADIRAARATLLERGVEPVSEIEGGPDQHWAYFKDAEGNLFEIVEPGELAAQP